MRVCRFNDEYASGVGFQGHGVRRAVIRRAPGIRPPGAHLPGPEAFLALAMGVM
jgi:hypothetical protein